MFSRITYAEKHDELEFINEHDQEIGFYRNLRTKEPFHCRKEKVGMVQVSEIFFFVEKEEKRIDHKVKKSTGNINQLEIF